MTQPHIDTDIDFQTDKAPFFSLNGRTANAKIVKVYDGDTVHAVFDCFGQYYKWKCRLAHIDTPEMRSKDAEQKRLAYVARDKLAEQILGRVVVLHCFEFDKYGRLLVEIDMPDQTQLKVHQWMIAQKYAKLYEGGTKEL